MTTRKTHAQALRDWLEDFDIYLALRQEDTPPKTWHPAVEFAGQPPPRAGQIRLWPACRSDEAPVYAVLLSGGYGCWRAIPFSPLAFPATPQEWRCHAEGSFRVLQGWNYREIDAAAAAQSWCAGEMDAESLFLLNSWWDSLVAGLPPPPAMERECGPPLIHPLDPRNQYLAEEWDRISRSLGETQTLQARVPMALAAEGGGRFGSRVWQIGDTGDRLAADAQGLRIYSSGGAGAWIGAQIYAAGTVLVWKGESIQLPQAAERPWESIEWLGVTYPLEPIDVPHGGAT